MAGSRRPRHLPARQPDSARYRLFGVAYDNWEDPADTIRMAAGMRFQAWVWCDGPLQGLTLRSGDSDRRLDFGLPLAIPRRAWIRLDIPLALLTDEAGRHPDPGRRIADLRLQAPQAPGQTLVLHEARLIIPTEPRP